MDIEQLRYPVGKFQRPSGYASELLQSWISNIENLPALMEKEVSGLTQKELNCRYRSEGWTIRQVIHHCADSHMNAFIRLKLALTENTPTIKTYHENLWAELPDTVQTSVEFSIYILRGLHHRWANTLKSLNDEQWNRSFFHPEQKREVKLWENTALYSWHCRHHLEHIRLAKNNPQ